MIPKVLLIHHCLQIVLQSVCLVIREETWEGVAGDEGLWHIQLRQASQRSHFILQDEKHQQQTEDCWHSSTRKVLMGMAAAAVAAADAATA